MAAAWPGPSSERLTQRLNKHGSIDMTQINKRMEYDNERLILASCHLDQVPGKAPSPPSPAASTVAAAVVPFIPKAVHVQVRNSKLWFDDKYLEGEKKICQHQRLH